MQAGPDAGMIEAMSSSTNTMAQWPAGGVKVMDGIYKLAGPSADASPPPTCDIVLFHGLSLDGKHVADSYHSTWRTKGPFHAVQIELN